MSPPTGTIRAPLFSEQVAIASDMNAAQAHELKLLLELAQQSDAQGAPPSADRLLKIGVLLTAVGFVAATAGAFTGIPLTIGAAVGLVGAAAGQSLVIAAVRAQRTQDALLTRILAQTISKRQRDGVA